MNRILILILFNLILMIIPLQAQKTVCGVVKDEQDLPLIGATVMIKGASQGIVTNPDGYYSIDVPDENAILVFSFIGYLSEEIDIGNQTEINLIMMPDITGLEEVVVIGYGTVKKRDLTAPVASVGARELRDIPLTSTAQALTGRLAGVQITTSEGSPGAEVKIRVRGGGSITQNNDPLYIVDGFPVDGIDDISPNDIESIDVLKDASATAIYGARGANGVVIITTKGGTEGKTQINYNFYIGQKKLANQLEVLDPHEYTLYQYERAQGNFQDRRRFEELYGSWDQLDSLYGNDPGINWQQEVFGRTALTMMHNLSVNGGSEKFNYNLSYTNNNDEGIMIESGYKRNNLNFRFQSKANEKLSFDFDARYSDLRISGAGTSDPGKSSQNRLRHSVMFRPTDGISVLEYDDEEYYSVSQLTDPLRLAKDEYRKQYRLVSNYNGALNFELVEGLKYRGEVGYYGRSKNDNRFYGLTTYLARRYEDKPVVRVGKDQTSRLRLANTLNYSNSLLGNRHIINVLIGQELVHTKLKEYTQETRLYPEDLTPELALGMMGLGEDPQAPESYESLDKLLSFFGRVNYNYRDKYLAQISLRVDGSTKFHQSHPWGFFPSGSLAWRISEENFMQNVNYISSLKLRLSYGQAGNNRIDNLLFLNRFETSSSKRYYLLEQENAYLYRPDAYNPNLKWETTITRDIGMDIGLFNGRFYATLDYYYNNTEELLVEVMLDPSIGYEEQVQNIAATTNYGFEAAFDAYIIERGDFRLSANFNIAFNRNRIDKLGSGLDEMLVTSNWKDDTGADYIVRVGDPVGQMYGFVTDGFYTVDDFEIDPETGEFIFDDEGVYVLKPGIANNQGITFAGFGPGSYKLQNLSDPLDSLGNPIDDGSLVTFEDDRTIVGNANPKNIGGLNIMAKFKWFDMSVFFNWVFGNNIYNANKIEFTSGYRPYSNLLTTASSAQRWTTVNEEGEVVTIPNEMAVLNSNATTWKPQTGRYLFHSWAVEDGSFVRINNITFGLTLPEELMKRVYIDNLRFYLTVNNVYTFTNYSGYDPEVDTRRDTPMTPGVDYSAYPRSRSYLVGLNLTF